MNKFKAQQILETANRDAEEIISAKVGEYNDFNRAHRYVHQLVFEVLIAERSPTVPLANLLALVEEPFEQLLPSRLH